MAKPSRGEIPPEKVNELLKMAGSDPKIQQSLKRGNLNEVLSNLPAQDAQMVRSVLNNPIQLQRILSTPEAQQLMKQLKMK